MHTWLVPRPISLHKEEGVDICQLISNHISIPSASGWARWWLAWKIYHQILLFSSAVALGLALARKPKIDYLTSGKPSDADRPCLLRYFPLPPDN